MQSVLKISEAASIGLHAMTYIAFHSNEPACTKDIAINFNVSVNHLSKVLQRLVKAGLLHSVKGPLGGFELTKKCEEITFLEIYEAIDGKLNEGCCLFGKKACGADKCIMGDFLNKTNKSVREFFGNKKLSDFCNQKKELENECF
ncbi:MAG TPA: Rrf2 family transcriptional regulator [Candidatus Gastranaerophilaceae bacterium]|nr:Rrf2 family transcriptional regulator [Candidatus Gastranaerophilaceae bacterium]